MNNTWCYAPHVIELLFSYMSAKQLNTNALVCTMWNRAVRSVKKNRVKKLAWYSHCSTDDPEERNPEKLFEDFFNNLYNEPAFMIVFCTNKNPWLQRSSYLFTSSSKMCENDTEVHEPRFLKHLPVACDVGICTSVEVIVAETNREIPESLKIGVNVSAAVCFPSRMGVGIYRFEMSGFPVGTSFNVDYDFYRHTRIPPTEPIKCLLVFLYNRAITDYSRSLVHKLVNYFILRTNGDVAIGGALVHHMYFPKHKRRRRNQSYGIAFTGENVEAASITIEDLSSNACDELETKFKLISESTFADGQCVAFMFTSHLVEYLHICTNCGNFEVQCMKLFRKYFPSVPLLGTSGGAGMGKDYIANSSYNDQFTYFDFIPKSVVFVIICMKNRS